MYICIQFSTQVCAKSRSFQYKGHLQRYPALSELAYGSSRRGCFENPDDVRPPSENLDCPDIAPLELEERDGLPNPLAMKNPSQLVRAALSNYYSLI